MAGRVNQKYGSSAVSKKAAKTEFNRDEGDKRDNKTPKIIFCRFGPSDLSRQNFEEKTTTSDDPESRV